MQLPFFYISDYSQQQQVILNSANSRHVVQVLRKKEGAELHLTDGQGHLITAVILDAHKKHCLVQVKNVELASQPGRKVCIAISPLKNASRFEWFLEKATELGVYQVIPLICNRTEKQQLRMDRLHNIMASAILQSRQVWLPQLSAPIAFDDYIAFAKEADFDEKFIAHCAEGTKERLPVTDRKYRSLLIGPEGDFTPAEISLALQNGYQPVSLGENRLRTETAGIVAATLSCI